MVGKVFPFHPLVVAMLKNNLGHLILPLLFLFIAHGQYLERTR